MVYKSTLYHYYRIWARLITQTLALQNIFTNNPVNLFMGDNTPFASNNHVAYKYTTV